MFSISSFIPSLQFQKFKSFSLGKPSNKDVPKKGTGLWTFGPSTHMNFFHTTNKIFFPLVGSVNKSMQAVSGKSRKRKPRLPSPYWKPVSPNQKSAYLAMTDPASSISSLL